MIEEDDPCFEATYRAVLAYWDRVGPSDPDLISYLVNPQLEGKPPWPNMRQAYRVVRPPGTVIVASDGLSDPFVDTDMTDANGLDMEVFVETPDLVGAGLEAIRESWAFRLVESFAMNVADWGGIAPQLRENGVMSLELPGTGLLPPAWLSTRATAGFLVNAPVVGRPAEILDTPFAPVMVVPLTLLHPAELEVVVAGGAAGRAEVAGRLAAAGHGHRSTLKRHGVV